MNCNNINILLAYDDIDDCMFFKEALEELQLQTTFTAVHDGEQLMQILTKKSNEIFHLLFLDLNMPSKNGFACLTEIKHSEKLQSLPVIILSTSYVESIANLLYINVAQHYICKPSDLSLLKKVIHQVITLVAKENTVQPPKENFLLINSKAILI